MKCIHVNVVIVGSGMAALQCAQRLRPTLSIALVTKLDCRTSSSYRAQGGIAAVSDPSDHAALHVADTLLAGEHHHVVSHVETLVSAGARAVHRLLAQGAPADYHGQQLSLGLEGAHQRHRIIHAGGDATGQQWVDYFLSTLPQNVTLYEHHYVYELLKNEHGEAIGVEALSATGERVQFLAAHVVIATGGAAALYEVTSNVRSNIGDGIALAWRAGARITDMEFMQFHPSLLHVNGQNGGLVSEAVRGQGGYFVDEHNRRIMRGVHPLEDLAPRHITAYTLAQRHARGEQTWLNIEEITDFEATFPTIAKLCSRLGVDIRQGRIPVAPGSHFLMGGIVTNDFGETTIPRLYAIGEAACTGVHGANRLASNSLLECIAFGERLAHFINEQHVAPHASVPVRTKTTEAIALLPRHVLQQHMQQALGIVRSEHALTAFLARLPTMEALLKFDVSTYPAEDMELIFMHCNARLMAEAAYARTESRGAHIRSDYPQALTHWAQQWLVFEQATLQRKEWNDELTKTRRPTEAVFP